jgi:hypothetical protein
LIELNAKQAGDRTVNQDAFTARRMAMDDSIRKRVLDIINQGDETGFGHTHPVTPP